MPLEPRVDVHEVAARREAGEGVTKLAKAYDVSRMTIYKWLAKADCDTKFSATMPSVETLATAYLERNASAAEIAKEHGVSERTVQRWLNKAGIRREAGDKNNKGKAGRPPLRPLAKAARAAAKEAK
jgi:transposase-like protein